jgi:hypothetical protein
MAAWLLCENGRVNKAMAIAPTVRTLAILRRKIPQMRRDPRVPFVEGDQIQALCPNCHVGTSHALASMGFVWPLAGQLPPDDDPVVTVYVWTCQYCGRASTVGSSFGPESAEVETWLVWPEASPRELPEAAPEAMRSLFREASRVEGIGAFRAAAALYRAAVEELVRHRKTDGPNLEKRIDALAQQGVDDDLVRDLHEARFTGNWSLHDGIAFSEEEIADLASLIEQAVHQLYVEPALRQKMREERRARREAHKGSVRADATPQTGSEE